MSYPGKGRSFLPRDQYMQSDLAVRDAVQKGQILEGLNTTKWLLAEATR